MSVFGNWLKRRVAGVAPADPAAIGRTITDALARAGLTAQQPGIGLPDKGVFRWPSTDRSSPTHGEGEPGRFVWSAVDNETPPLRFKLYTPATLSNVTAKVPLIVMLHGCTQDPDDFALGTRMNALAEQHRAIIAYPQQPSENNVQKCWNWFRPDDQMAGRGEPERIAAMIRQLITTQPVDRRRIFVAGMSAGGAMALIVGRCYPELIAGVGVHSGLPYRCANNVASAMSAMRDARTAHTDATRKKATVPLIVIRGEQDRTVDPANGDLIVSQAVRDWGTDALRPDTVADNSIGGHHCRHVVYRDERGDAKVESWTIGALGHQWSGGDSRGSHTDSGGPDASLLMMRFFMSVQEGVSHEETAPSHTRRS